MDEDLKYWIALNDIKDRATARSLGLIIDDGGGAGPADVAGAFERHSAERGRKKGKARRPFRGWDWAERELELAQSRGVRVITIRNALYPDLLRQIYDPPLVLYIKGELYGDALPVLAIVGTRRASHYGLSMAGRIAAELAGSGVVVASGMARGCDSAAHRGALDAGGRTIAVLGSGIDVVYPKENKRLYDEIAEKGGLVSEFPFSTPPVPRNFPVRNRIISGLALGVVVVEAPLRSGAMMTARLALESSREVFALPGMARSKTCEGTNKLIKDGAALVEDAADIFGALWPGRVLNQPGTQDAGHEKPALKGDAGRIAELLSGGPLHIDGIARESGLTVQKLSPLLLDMELKGIIEQRPGNLFIKKF